MAAPRGSFSFRRMDYTLDSSFSDIFYSCSNQYDLLYNTKEKESEIILTNSNLLFSQVKF